jgi:CBS domain-containing protein
VLSLSGEGTDLDAVRVGDVMTRSPFTIDVRAAVLDAARLMGEKKIRHLTVVDGEGEHLLGMVGIRDVLGSLVELLWQTHDTAAHETARALFKR